MGEPKKIRKKYQTPRHPWEKTRIDEEKKLTKEYGFSNKKEIWKVTSKLKQFKDRAKTLSALTGAQSELETKQLIQKLRSINLLAHDQELNYILGVEVGALAERRLQSIVFKKKLARSVKQARQMIVHRHILVNDTTITSPAYIVDIAEEGNISFSVNSPFFSTEHPERFSSEGMELKPEEKEELALKKEQDAKYIPKSKPAKKANTKSKSKEPSKTSKESVPTDSNKDSPVKPVVKDKIEAKPAEAVTPEELQTAEEKAKPVVEEPAKETKESTPKDTPVPEEKKTEEKKEAKE